MVDPVYMQTQDSIAVPDDVSQWERHYRLPEISGSPPQIAWARLVRHRFLSHVFKNVLDATSRLDGATAKAVYACLGEIRADTNSRQWIEVFRLRLSDPTATVLAMPARRAALRAEEERQGQEVVLRDRRAAGTRKLNSEARKWEALHGLPDVTGASGKQVNLGRRCRYQLCRDRPDEARRLPTDAGYWIATYEGVVDAFAAEATSDLGREGDLAN
jgi:hypothetical protein